MAFVRIAHPDVEGTASVTESAYERLWAAKGWRRVDETVSQPDAPVVPITDLPPLPPVSDTPIADAVTAALATTPPVPTLES